MRDAAHGRKCKLSAHVHHRPHSRPHARARAADHSAPGKARSALPYRSRVGGQLPRRRHALRPADEALIRVYDQFGRAVAIGRESWRRDVLLPNLQSNRDNPDALYDLIVSALNDDFAADVLESARPLAANDPQPQRGATVLGVVLLQLRDFAGAREVLERRASPGTATMPIYWPTWRVPIAASGDDERAQALIWRALQLEPNEEIVAQLADRARPTPRAGQDADAGRLRARRGAAGQLARAAVAGASRARARRSRRGHAALRRSARTRANPVPADLLMQLSGDLGNRGHTELLVRLTQPALRSRSARPHRRQQPAARLRRARHVRRGAQAARAALFAAAAGLARAAASTGSSKLDDAQKRYGEVTAPLEIVLMKLEQPVWARGVLGFEAVLPAKSARRRRASISSAAAARARRARPDGKVVSQPTNELGRIARALPMFLAEEFYLRTNARTAFLLPWMKQGGFILSAKPWTRGFLPPDHAPPDCSCSLHIDARAVAVDCCA